MELSKKELQNELNVFKSKLSGDEDSVQELQNQLSQMKLRCEQAERKCSELIEENERIHEEMSSVSTIIPDNEDTFWDHFCIFFSHLVSWSVVTRITLGSVQIFKGTCKLFFISSPEP